MTDRLPEMANSEPRDRFFVNKLGMIRPRPMPASAAKLLGGVLAALVLLPAELASAQGKLDARYEVTLSGISVGKGSWVVDIADDQYSASASGATAGLLKAFASGSGTGGSQGRVVNGALLPQAYSATVISSKKSETIRMSLDRFNIKERSSRSRRSIPTASRSPTRIGVGSRIR